MYSDLLVMFARTYDRMGDVDTARTLAGRAYRQSVDAFGPDDPRSVRALALRGRMHARFGDRAQARADLEAARSRLQRSGDDGATLAMVLDDMGTLELYGDHAGRAAGLFAEAQQQRLQSLGPAHPDIEYTSQSIITNLDYYSHPAMESCGDRALFFFVTSRVFPQHQDLMRLPDIRTCVSRMASATMGQEPGQASPGTSD